MGPEELYQLADDELRLGIAEPALWRQALDEANGINAVAIQKYWQLRSNGIRRQAAQLGEADANLLFEGLQNRFDGAKRRNAGRVTLGRYRRLSALALGGSTAHIMLMLNWLDCSAVERVPGKVSGTWLFRGTRVPVKALFENLEGGATVEEFLEWFPGVTRKQVETVLEHAQRSLIEA
jgi:uncharacterized protein (DUF433 family)